MSEWGAVYEAYIDAYMKEYTCSREVAIESLNQLLAKNNKEKND